jgi:predicted phosphohydrolase
MTRIAWLTDIHLNFLGIQQIEAFLQNVCNANPDIVLISGDIGEARSIHDYLHKLERDLQRPIYYVLGNHDFYFGSIAHVRAGMEILSESSPYLRWLPTVGVLELSPETALVGHDGWADGRCGNYERSNVMLNDYVLISEFLGLEKSARLGQMNALGDEAADYFRQVLPDALERYRHVYVVTHVPPFKESCWHNGSLSDDHFLPHFTCVAVGEALRDMMQSRPDREMTVLCGHTHGAGEAQILPNLRVITGGAEYGAPVIQRVFDVGED